MLRRHLPALLLAGCGSTQAAAPVRVTPGSGLHARAAAKGLAFGAAITARQLGEPDLVAALLADCGLLVPEYEQKWRIIEPERGRRSFAGPDMIARFARVSGMGLRGHTLLWHESEPGWAGELTPAALAEAADRHVAVTAAHFAGRITTWDVLNEAIHIADGRPDWLRRTRLLRLLGPDYIPRAFTLARAADPAARLAYNDYGCEHATLYGRRKRLAVLALLRALKASGAPVQVLGVQGHLSAHLPFEANEWRDFLGEVAQLGLTIEITELDVNDRALPAAPGPRDAAVADLTRRFLDASLAEPALRSVTAWGLSDRHSWVRRGVLADHRRRDSALARPLPYDDEMRRKPMWHAIAAAFDSAPVRPAV
jgi:endo-1,4-beta-xylanase